MESKDQRRVQETPEATTEKESLAGYEKGAEARLSRRRALIAGLAAAPVVLTLMNRSAWGSSCSDPTVASYQAQGLTASFQAHHPNAYINSGGQLQCRQNL